MQRTPRIALILLVVGAVIPLRGVPARAENWPEWRGPSGTGVCADKSLPLEWSGTQNVRWRVPLPDRGNSTPIIWGDRIFLTQAIEAEHRRTLLCFNRADGRLLWQSGVTYTGHEPTNAENPYCSGSPCTDGTHVVAYFGSAGLYCYDFSGKERWHRDVGRVDSWQGSGSSPIIHGKLCFLNAGPGTHAALIACDVDTGNVAWKVIPPKVDGGAAPGAPPPAGGGFDNAMMQADPSGAGGFRGSWSTPVILHSAARDQLVVVHPYQVSGYDPESGHVLWTCDGLPDQAFASPAVGDGVLVATGHRVSGGGTRVTAIQLAGIVPAHRLWQVDLPKDCVGSGVIVSGHLYLVTQFGSIICLRIADGSKVWEKRLSGRAAVGGSWSSIVVANDRLIIPNHSGEVFVLAASPEFKLLATNWAADETTCASAAISDGALFLRTYKALWCFGSPPGR